MTPSELRDRLAQFARDVELLTRPFVRSLEARDSVLQLRRAAASVAANQRAAGRGRSHAEFTSKVQVALEEADEAVFWLEHLTTTRLLGQIDLSNLLSEARQIAAILASSVITARRRDADAKARNRKYP